MKSEMSWIVVSNLKKALDYYTKVLGLQLKEHNQEFGWAELVGSDGGARLGVAQANKDEPMKPGQNAVMTFTVKDLKKAKEDLTKKGLKFVGDVLEVPGVVKIQSFEDQDKNQFQLCQHLS